MCIVSSGSCVYQLMKVEESGTGDVGLGFVTEYV
jgi:hypothetical protein